MKLTNSMRRCLILLARNGEVLWVWYGKSGHEWCWRINGTRMSSPVDCCMRAAFGIGSFSPREGDCF
jgi:hypothetical protein